MDRTQATAVVVGAICGAAARGAAVTLLEDVSWFGDRSPLWALVVINTIGSAALGLVVARTRHGDRTLERLGLGVGLCGGFTTFSAFAVDTADLIHQSAWSTAGGFVAVSVALGVGGVVAGVALGSIGAAR